MKDIFNRLRVFVKYNAPFKFIFKALGAYAVWYILYNIILSPAGWFDSWTEHYLVLASAWLLSAVGYSVLPHANILWIHRLAGIEVSSGCDGLAAIGLFISFLVAYPGDKRKRLLMILSGSVILVIGNILRICVLTLSQLYWPGSFNFFHLYLTEAVYDGIVLALWIFWVNWGRVKGGSEEVVNSSGAIG